MHARGTFGTFPQFLGFIISLSLGRSLSFLIFFPFAVFCGDFSFTQGPLFGQFRPAILAFPVTAADS